MMRQYQEIKAAHPDCLLFYRMGDFYELFFEDAEIASRALGIVLTKRGKHNGADIPMCGVPVVRSDEYLHKLIAAGFRVAVCEQTEDPAEAKKRGAKSVVTESGIEIGGIKPLSKGMRFDLILVPGINHHRPRDLLDRRAEFEPEFAALRAMHLRGSRIAATCSGTYLLAMSGLLDGHRATTSWWMASSFRKHFPNVRLEEQALLVEDGNVITTGASTAVFSLVQRIIAQVAGDELAQQTSRMMLLDSDRQSQAPYVSQALLEKPRHSLAEKITHFLERELQNQISVSRLASHCGTSERSLLRHFRAAQRTERTCGARAILQFRRSFRVARARRRQDAR